ncbi:poly-beta-1,6-N-acetyl-D-glucosamine N-deacetylase PgaB [candidate division CSSED10-310 bacterium]|uniref:Poly-beta-1,6-N-acetyl-D-glucosamine N-deacetylase PgaB n=1 Tax=candidate division CSSED10-310 bacterium TaxID=2855610 RepID=A0ABV6YR22_UNCC1
MQLSGRSHSRNIMDLEYKNRSPSIIFLLFIMFVKASVGVTDTDAEMMNSPPRIGVDDTPILAVQLFDLNFRQQQDFDQLFQTLKSHGFNTVFMRVFQNIEQKAKQSAARSVTGTYFRSPRSPLMRDMLKLACQAAQKNNINLYAWMTTRHCDWIREKHRDWCDKRYNLKTHQEEVYDRLDICNPHFRTFITQLFEDLAHYPIQGILFQDDIVLRHTEGFSEFAKQRYFHDTGRAVSAAEMYRKTRSIKSKVLVTKYGDTFFRWRQWRIAEIMNFLNLITEQCRKVNPNLKFALNCYYETLTAPENARTWFAQDISYAKNSSMHLFSFMAYHRQIAQETNISIAASLKLLGKMTRNACRVLETPSRVLMKIQVRDWQTHHDVDWAEIKEAIRFIRNEGAVGIALVPYRKNLPLKEIQGTTLED